MDVNYLKNYYSQYPSIQQVWNTAYGPTGGGGGTNPQQPTSPQQPQQPTAPQQGGQQQGTGSIFNAYQDYWQDTSPGSAIDWAGGQLERTGEGKAVYTSPLGRQVELTPESDLWNIAQQSPFIYSEWQQRYPEAFNTMMEGQGSGFFDVPKDKYPQTFNLSSSGVNWQGPLAGSILDQLVSASQQVPGLAEQIPDELASYYDQTMQNALGPQAFQGTLNNLAERGMLDSSVASDAMAQTASDLIRDIGDKAYQSQLAGLRTQMDVPSILGEIAGLGDRTESVGLNSNPLAPYQLMANVLGMM
jgi:hypothetical protein